MTRDEAMQKLMAETRSECTSGAMGDFLDCAVALGMLKLDEPKDKFQVFCQVLRDWRNAGTEGANALANRMEAAGLTIEFK